MKISKLASSPFSDTLQTLGNDGSKFRGRGGVYATWKPFVAKDFHGRGSRGPSYSRPKGVICRIDVLLIMDRVQKCDQSSQRWRFVSLLVHRPIIFNFQSGLGNFRALGFDPIICKSLSPWWSAALPKPRYLLAFVCD